ncbi:MAG: hypothetical protein AAGA09_02135 [Pseudomonadota bacterium]
MSLGILKNVIYSLVTMVAMAALGAMLVADAAVARARVPRAADVQISVSQLPDASMRVVYTLRRPMRELIFDKTPGRYRASRWRFETPGFELQSYEGEDHIVMKSRERFERVVLVAKPHTIRMRKEYQPIARYGEGGAMVYTGHFWPMTRRGWRADASFDFTPARGGDVVAFGARAPALRDWRSPMAHPAFVYMGPIEPVETDNVMALIDPEAPPWIIAEFYGVTPRAFGWLADQFGFSPNAKPNLFLAAPLGEDEGRLSYSGDALPAQFQITLEGAAWRNPTDQAKNLFRRSTIHEAVHLWQSSARPAVEEVASWIHEGAADAIAAETLVGLGLWDAKDMAEDFERARAECAGDLNHGPLSTAQYRGRYRAIYACGHVIAAAVSRADGASVVDFWREFVALARENGGYSEALFYDLVLARTGDRAFTDQVRYFVRTPHAKPARDIERLMAASRAPLASPAAR